MSDPTFLQTSKACQAVANILKNARILVVGDVIHDRFINGFVERISSESPVPVLCQTQENSMLGGAGNVVSNLAGLQLAKVGLIACVGDDGAGAQIKENALIRNIDISGLVTAPKPTTIKTRFLAGHQQLFRCDQESKAPIDDQTAQTLMACVAERIHEYDALILSDYGLGVLREDVVQNIIQKAHEAGKPVLVDPRGKDFSKYKGADVITPNRKELSLALQGAATTRDSDIEKACRDLIHSTGIHAVVATRSQDGMTIYKENETLIHLPTEAIDVFDVSGAGDTVIATIAASMAMGANLETAARLANIAAGIVVGKVGTAPVLFHELEAALVKAAGGQDQGTQLSRRLSAPVCDFKSAADQVKTWRSRGLVIGFTNGCFDILHAGHVTYLQQAREQCDRLILGLNSDSSVKRLKGEARPVNDFESRATVLAALGAIDMIVPFGDAAEDEDTPLRLIETLSPDVLIKGSDYTIETAIGSKHVLANGGRVWLAPLSEGKSTTNIINRIQNTG